MNMKQITVADLIERRERPGDAFQSGSVLYYNRLICKGGKNGRILFDTAKNKPEFIQQFYPAIISAIWVEIWEHGGKSVGFGPQTYEAVMLCYVEHESWKRLISDEELETAEVINTLKELKRNDEATLKWGVHQESKERAARHVKALDRAIESIEREAQKDG